MLVIEAVRALLHDLLRMPRGAQVGLAVMVTAGLIDVVLHLGGGGHEAHHAAVSQHLAHVLGVAGMVLVLVAVVIDGSRRQRRASAAHGGLDSNAHR